MRRRLLLCLAPVLLFGAPADAHAACGVPSARAEYETPEVQVYAKGPRLIACHRATGRERGVGRSFNDGMGTDEATALGGVLGGRWVWTSLLATFAESADVRVDTLVDLRTGRKVEATVEDEETDAEAVAVSGALVVAGADGVTVRHVDGRTEKLSSVAATRPAAAGARVYWTEGDVARTALLTLPTVDPPQRKPLARTVGKCKPRPGARLLVRVGRLVVSRAGGETWACRGGKTRRVTDTADVRALSDREVLYPGGFLDVVSGKRQPLAGSEPATDGAVAYWLDSAATPRVIAL